MSHSAATARRATRNSRRRRAATGLGLLLATAGATLVTGQFSLAAAATKFDGTWTLNHGGTGQIFMNGDYTYTSTCKTLPTFPGAACPSASGTFSFNFSSPYVTFTGSDGRSMSMRYTGLAVSPDAMNQGGLGGLMVARGTAFKCSVFYDSTYAFARTPLVYKNAAGTKGFALGSDQSVGAINAGNYVFLAETAPGYFTKSSKCPA